MVTGSREQGAGSKEQGAGSRERGAVLSPAGCSRHQLEVMHD